MAGTYATTIPPAFEARAEQLETDGKAHRIIYNYFYKKMVHLILLNYQTASLTPTNDEPISINLNLASFKTNRSRQDFSKADFDIVLWYHWVQY